MIRRQRSTWSPNMKINVSFLSIIMAYGRKAWSVPTSPEELAHCGKIVSNTLDRHSHGQSQFRPFSNRQKRLRLPCYLCPPSRGVPHAHNLRQPRPTPRNRNSTRHHPNLHLQIARRRPHSRPWPQPRRRPSSRSLRPRRPQQSHLCLRLRTPSLLAVPPEP